MSDNPFSLASSGSWRPNAVAGGYYCHPYIFIEGYYKAADILSSSAINDSQRLSDLSLLFHPVCYSYRHFIELNLKYLIVKSEKLYSILEKLGSTKGKLAEYVEPKLVTTHKLEILLNWLNERSKFIDGKGLDKELRDVIMYLDDIDPDGQNFRFPSRTDGSSSFPNQFGSDLTILRKNMERVHSDFMGFDDYWGEQIREASELLHESNNSID